MDYNYNSPTAVGMETRYAWSWVAPDWTSSLRGVQERIRPGAVTLAGVHLCLPVVKGSPGIAVEIIDTQQPVATYDDFYPGIGTGSVAVGFEDQAGGAVDFGDVNDPFDDTDYARNAAPLSANGSAFLRFRGNNAGALAGRRILRVQIQALVMNRATGVVNNNAFTLPVRGAYSDGSGAGDQYGNFRSVAQMDSFQTVPDLGDWLLSPATGLPWTLTEVNNILDPAHAARFGIDVFGRAGDEGVRVSAFWLRVWHCAENRKGFLYRRGAPRRGWDRYVLGSTAALLANQYYWIAVSALSASSANYFSLGYVYPLEGKPAAAPTVSTQEHRTTTGVLLSGPGGVAQPGFQGITGESETVFGALVDVAGTIQPQSQAFVEVFYADVYSGSQTNLGQQITTAGSVPGGGYAGVTLTCGWAQDALRPDRPLRVEVRSGVGAISGGGVLEATATLRPEQTIEGSIIDRFIRFDGGNWTPAINTQYHLIISSDCSPFGWRIPVADTRSDLILAGSGTTVANVEGASFNGQTDSYVQSGGTFDRFDFPIAFTAPPTGPTGPTVTEYDAEYATVGNMTVPVNPPRTRVRWAASTLTTAFGGYRVWVRRRTTPAEQPQLVGEITPDSNGSTPAQIEANHREFWLYELGWSVAGGFYENGWEVGVSVINATTKLESLISWSTTYPTPSTASTDWLCSNAAPWLNSPLPVLTRSAPSDAEDPPVIEQVGGRDGFIVRTSGKVPGRTYKIEWTSDASFPDESILAGVRACAVSGRQVAWLRCRGDRNFGVIKEPGTDFEPVQLAGNATFWTTSTPNGIQEEPADANMPPGYVLNGTSQRIDHADNVLLDPASGPFTVVLYAVVPAAASKILLSKRGATDGYEFATDASGTLVSVTLDGTLASLALHDSSVALGADAHVWTVTSPGAGTGTKRLYNDGDLVDTSTVDHGAIANSDSLNIGGDGGGGFSALGPVIAYGVWMHEFTPEEAVASARYLKASPLAGKVPPGAAPFVDLRDSRCYGHAGKVSDLSGNYLDGTLVGSPVLRGIPWPIEELERKR